MDIWHDIPDFKYIYYGTWAGIAQSVQRLGRGWTVRGSNPVPEARFSAPVQTLPGAHPASYTMGTGSFLGVDWPGRGFDHPPPSSAEVKERVELYLYSPSGSLWRVLGGTLPSAVPFITERRQINGQPFVNSLMKPPQA